MQYPNRARAGVALTVICALVVVLSCFTPISVQAQENARKEAEQLSENTNKVPDSSPFIETDISNGLEPDDLAEIGKRQLRAGATSYTAAFTRDVTSEAMGEQLLTDAGVTPIAIEFAHGEGSAEFAATEEQAEALAESPFVAGLIVTPAIEFSGAAVAPQLQSNPGWALDSLDGTNDGSYKYDFTGKRVHAYVIDSMLDRRSEFSDRIRGGYDVTSSTDNPYRCTGTEDPHGTYVTLALAGGEIGVGRDVLLHNVAMYRCDETIIPSWAINEGLRWIEDNLELPAVVNISWKSIESGSDGDVYLTYERTVSRLIDRGAVVVAASGNNGKDACSYAPTRVPGVFTVGALYNDLSFATASNSGECVEAFAPGYGVPIAGRTKYGTSFAAPYATGIAAQVLERDPTRTPAGVASQLLMDARHDIGGFGAAIPGSTNARVQTHKATDYRAPIVEVRTRPTSKDRTRAIIAIEPESYIYQRFEVFLDGSSRVQGTLQSNASGQTVVRLNGIPPGRHILSVEVAGNKIFSTRIFGFDASDSMTVVPAVSCLGSDGRVDLNIINTASTRKRFRIEFGNLSPREYDVAPGDYWRMPFTGRPDGAHKIVVSADGFADWETVADVSCDDPQNSQVSPGEIRVVNACKNGNGYVAFQFTNPTDTTRGYVIEFGSTPRRSTSAAPGGQAFRAVSGRPDGVHPVRIMSGTRVLANFNVIVDCDNTITTRDTVSAR